MKSSNKLKQGLTCYFRIYHMMRKILFLVICVGLLMSCASEVSILDSRPNCEENPLGYLTVVNNTMDASMDIYLNNEYIVTLPPQGNHYVSDLKFGPYELEGRESNGFRMWLKDIEIVNCDDITAALGE